MRDYLFLRYIFPLAIYIYASTELCASTQSPRTIVDALNASIKAGECGVELYIDFNYTGKIPVYDDEGNITNYLQKQIDNPDDILCIIVIKQTENRYYVGAYHFWEWFDAGNEQLIVGWIDKQNNHIMNIESDSAYPLKLYIEPDTSSSFTTLPQGNPHGPLFVTEKKGCWVKITTECCDGMNFSGWMDPDDYRPSPL